MGFLDTFFRKPESKSVVLIDIGAESIAGAYALFSAGAQPTVLYGKRVPIIQRLQEPGSHAMVRALEVLGEALVREGAPTLLRVTGKGSTDDILVSIDAPWQETALSIERLEQKIPFLFTKEHVKKTLEKARKNDPAKIVVDESVIATTINGYATNNPYNKEAKHASILILTSSIDKEVLHTVDSTLSRLYHTKKIRHISGASLRYQAMRAAFPHERDMLIIDASGKEASVTMVRKGFLVAVHDASSGASVSLTERVKQALMELSKEFPLPHTIFLIARDTESNSRKESIENADVKTFWLANSTPKVIPVAANHLSSLVASPNGVIDIPLLFMALYYQHHGSQLGTIHGEK